MSDKTRVILEGFMRVIFFGVLIALLSAQPGVSDDGAVGSGAGTGTETPPPAVTVPEKYKELLQSARKLTAKSSILRMEAQQLIGEEPFPIQAAAYENIDQLAESAIELEKVIFFGVQTDDDAERDQLIKRQFRNAKYYAFYTKRTYPDLFGQDGIDRTPVETLVGEIETIIDEAEAKLPAAVGTPGGGLGAGHEH